MSPLLQRVLHVEDDASIQAVARVALEIVGGLQVLSCSGIRHLRMRADRVLVLRKSDNGCIHSMCGVACHPP